MYFVCKDPDSYLTKVVGDGQCAVFVQVAAGAPTHLAWKEGKKIKKLDAPLPKGTAIATFIDGKYPSHTHGNHAAIYVGQNAEGLQVYDQWCKKDKLTGKIEYQPVHPRTIYFSHTHGLLSNNGNAFSVIE
jgi:hypothetical protein